MIAITLSDGLRLTYPVCHLPSALAPVDEALGYLSNPTGLPIPCAHRGHQAILAEVLVALPDDPERFAAEPEERFAVDDGRVSGFGRYRIGAGNGAEPCEIRFLDVVTMRDGYIVRYQSYFDGVGFREALFPAG
jgi:ketosteroid isomerase-like protein